MVPRFVIAAVSMAAAATTAAAPRWSERDLAQLADLVASARDEGLRETHSPIAIAMMAPGPGADAQADRIAIGLARDFREGSARIRSDPTWHFPPPKFDYPAWLDGALAGHRIVESFRALLPATANYSGMRAALVRCRRRSSDCATIAINLDRLRALPRDLGEKYLWVNVPAYRLDLVEHGRVVASHKVIVGKPDHQTPSFRAAVTGVTVNPWWNVPCSIVDESVGKLVRTNPREAARRGYVATKGPRGTLIVRQKPGPDNALGRIKLEMPNPYDVFIHDTPSRALFLHDRRAFSHGCIRTENPTGLATTLLGDRQKMAIDLLLASGVSRTIPLASSLPVYVVYLTAELDPRSAETMTHRDIYRRDRD